MEAVLAAENAGWVQQMLLEPVVPDPPPGGQRVEAVAAGVAVVAVITRRTPNMTNRTPRNSYSGIRPLGVFAGPRWLGQRRSDRSTMRHRDRGSAPPPRIP